MKSSERRGLRGQCCQTNDNLWFQFITTNYQNSFLFFFFFTCLATGIIWVIIPLEWGSPLKIFSCTCLSRWYINCLRFFPIFYLIRCSRRRGGESWTPHQEAVDRTHAILRCERKWLWFYHEWHSYIKTSREKQLFDKEKPHRLVAESEVLLGVDYVVVLLFSFGCLFVFKFYVSDIVDH